MIDLIKRIVITLIGAVILYTAMLFSFQAVIVQPEYSGMNLVSLWAMIRRIYDDRLRYISSHHPMQKRHL